MPKNGVQGSGALPTGQAQRGFPNQSSHNNKNGTWDGEKIPAHNDPQTQAKRGYPSADNRNTSKSGGSGTAADDALTNYPSYNQPATPSTTTVSANRLRRIGSPS